MHLIAIPLKNVLLASGRGVSMEMSVSKGSKEKVKHQNLPIVYSRKTKKVKSQVNLIANGGDLNDKNRSIQ